MRWRADPRSALIKQQAWYPGGDHYKLQNSPSLHAKNQGWFQFCHFVLCSQSSLFFWSSSARIHSVFVDHLRKTECTLRSSPGFTKKKLTGYQCGRGSCHTLWPGGPSLGRAQAWCVWSRGRTHPVHRPCSGAWTLPQWRFWSTGGTGWCPGLAPSSLAEPHLSQNLRGVDRAVNV